MMKMTNTFVLEYSFSQNCFVCITKLEQITSNRTCLLENIPHDFIPIGEFETKDLLEDEADFLREKLASRPPLRQSRFFSNN